MKRVLVVVVLLAVVLGSGGYAVAQARQPEAAYSTAKATRADVERTLDLSGTITATGRRDLSFGTDGTVAKVSAHAGQRVRKGQVLARLQTTSLDATVTAAVATLARAKAQLASDEDAQSSAVSSAVTPSRSSSATQKPRSSKPSNPNAPTTKPDPALQQALAELATEQKAVTSAQSDASEAIAVAKSALAAQTQACQPTDDDSSDDTDPSIPAACTTALGAVQDAQDTVADRQATLQSALDALSKTLGTAVAAVTKSGQTDGPDAGPAPGPVAGCTRRDHGDGRAHVVGLRQRQRFERRHGDGRPTGPGPGRHRHGAGQARRGAGGQTAGDAAGAVRRTPARGRPHPR